MVGPGGEAPDGGLAGWDHRAGVVQLCLFPEERVRLHVEGEVTVLTCRTEGSVSYTILNL